METQKKVQSEGIFNRVLLKTRAILHKTIFKMVSKKSLPLIYKKCIPFLVNQNLSVYFF